MSDYKTTQVEVIAVTMIRINDGSFPGESDVFVPCSFEFAVDGGDVCENSVVTESFGVNVETPATLSNPS